MKVDNDKKSSEKLAEFLAFYREVVQLTEFHTNAIEDYNSATQDILHQFEFGSYDERKKFGTQLHRIRKDRRKSKDYLDINKEIVEYFKSQEMIQVYRKLEQLLGKIRKKESEIEGQRAYRPRVLDNLTIRTVSKEEKSK